MISHRRKIRQPVTAVLAWLVPLLFVVCGCASPTSQLPSTAPLAPASTATSSSADSGPAVAAPASDQVGSPAAGRRIKFRQLTIEDGLSQSTVNCIVQDSRGFMWFGTQDGLNRYDGYEFRVYERDPGDPHSLSANWVQHCYRDPADRLWFVTDDSVLHRYDPALDRFERYPLDVEDPHWQGANNVRALLGDRAGRLWIGTYGAGLVRYDPEADRLVYYRKELDDPARDGQNDNKVYTIYEDRAGTLWFGTGEGLVRYDEPARAFVRYPYQAASIESPAPGDARVTDALRSPFVTTLLEDAEGRLWVGTSYGGLHQLDRETGRVTAYPFSADEPNTFSGSTVRRLLADREGKLWVASAEVTPGNTFERLGLERLDPETGKIVRFAADVDDPCELSHDAVLLMHEDRQGTLWFHTFAGGVDVYDRQTGCFDHYQHDPGNPRTLSDDSITLFYEDESGGLWLGTGAGGVSFYHPTWTRFPSHALDVGPAERESNNIVWHFYAPPSGLDADGHVQRLWVSTGAGINLWDRGAGTFTFYQIDPDLPDLLAYAFHEDAAGTLWVGTSMGLYRGVPAAGSRMSFELVLPRIAPGVGNVTAILPAGEGDHLWLGRYRIGLVHFDPVAGEVVRTYEPGPADPDSLADGGIRGIFPGRDGRLWITTISGLEHFDPATEAFVHHKHDPDDAQSLSDAYLNWVYEDKDGVVWVGTNGDGLQRLDPATGAWTHYREEEGLPNDVVYAVLPEHAAGGDALWLSTNNGLSRFDPATGTFRNYTHRDGLQSNEFNARAACLAADGEMFFGGVAGFNAFYPAQIWDDPYAPPVYITGLLLANRPAAVGHDAVLQQSVGVARSATLSYRDRVVSFEFAALYYAMPERVQYAYMLEGFDDDWIPAGDRRFVTYTSLPPRDYVFRVKAANPDGVWNEIGASLTITVEPPLWGTWWFRVLAGVFATGVVATGYRLRVRSIEERARALERQVAGRTEELSTLNAIANVVSASLDLDQILDGALAKTLEVMGYDAGGIYLLQRDPAGSPGAQERLNLVAHRGIDASLLAAIDGLAVGEGFSGRVVQTGQPLLVDDLSADGRLTRTAVKDRGYRSLAIAPLVSRGKVVGSLFVMTSDRVPRGEQDLELLTSIAGQVAVAVENARLFEAEQRRAEQFRVIGEVGRRITSLLDLDSVLNQVTSLVQRSFGYDHVGIALIEEGYAVYKVGAGELWDQPDFQFRPARLKIGEEGITGRVAAEGKPLLVPDVTQDPRYVWMEGSQTRSELALPLVVRDRVIGVLDVQSNRLDAFDDSDVVVLQSLADQAAVAIENAGLFDAEQRRAEQFRVISEVGSHVASILTVEDLLEQVARLIQGAFNYYLVEIGLVEGPDLVFKTRAGRDGEDGFESFRLAVNRESITGYVAATGQPLLVPDVDQEPRYVQVTITSTRSEMALPMKVQDKIIGVINVQSDRLHAFDQSDLAVLQSLANQAAIAIENARLYEQAQKLAVMEERQRLARELHDAVTQTLFSASLIAEAVPDLWETDQEEGRALLAELRQLSRGALAEMRTLLLELRPAALVEANLRDLLRQLGEAAAGRTSGRVTVAVDDDLCPLPEEVHVALYRIAQEALNNVVKHAQASQVEVRLRCLDGDKQTPDQIPIELCIHDDGRGFDPAQIPPERLGLGIIRERAQAIGARLEIESRPGHGTRITVVWREER